MKTFFKDCDFADKPESIKEYSLWAVRYDGPGFYQGPTPRQCTYPRDHDHYIVSFCFLVRRAIILTLGIQKPTGAFQSHFIISVAKKFLRYVEKSLLEPKIDAKLNPPVGLFGMLLLSVCIPSVIDELLLYLSFRLKERLLCTLRLDLSFLPLILLMIATGESWMSISAR